MKTPIALKFLENRLKDRKNHLKKVELKTYEELKRKDEIILIVKDDIKNLQKEIEILKSL